MNLLYSGYNYRNVDNFRPLLDELSRRGHHIGYCVFPHPVPAKNLELGEAPFHRVACVPCNSYLTEPALPELREALQRGLREVQPDALLLDDILNYPSSALYSLAKELAPELPVLAFQHGFYQFWSRYRRFFACDVYLAYGDRFRRQLLPHQQERAVSFGLPKLSRLRGVPVQDDGTVLYLAQDTPRWEVVASALKGYTRMSGRRVVVRLHPQYAERYQALSSEGLELQYATDDVTPHLAGCHAVVTTGSTAGMEALVLGKPVVSLPSYSSSIFNDSPCMAFDLTGEEIWRVLAQWPERQQEVQHFLEESISPLSFDMRKAADCFEELVSRRSVPQPGDSEAARLAALERRLLAQQAELEQRDRLLHQRYVEQLAQQKELAEQQQALAREQARAEALAQEGSHLRAQLEQAGALQQQLQSRHAELQAELQAERARGESLSRQCESLQARGESLSRQCESLQLRGESLSRELEARQAELQAERARSESLQRECESLRARLEAPPALRHRVVDELNTQFKRAAPGLQRGLKRALTSLKQLRS